MRIGRMRARLAVVRCQHSGLFVDSARLPEGNVYRLRISFWLIKVLVDWQSDRERLIRRRDALSAWAIMEEGLTDE